MDRNAMLSLAAALLSSSVVTALINILYDIRNKKRDAERGHADGRLRDWREISEKLDRELDAAREEMALQGRKIAGLERDLASLEQYAVGLEVIIRHLDPGARVPPRPHREQTNF